MSSPTHSEMPEPPLKPWQAGIGPAYIGLFLLIVFFDRLGPYTLAVGGLVPSVLGAGVGGLLAFGMLYYAPAMAGLRSRRDLIGLSARTFGTSGAAWVPGVVLGLVQVVWFAVAIGYAADLSLKAVVLAGLTDPRAADAPQMPAIPAFGGPAYLFLIGVWMLTAAILGPLLVRIVGAIMHGYSAIPALAFGGLMLWSMGGLADYAPPEGIGRGAAPAFWSMVQLVFGFAATAGVMAVDWGAASPSARDVRRGGLVGVGLAPLIVASVALVTVAGAIGRALPADPLGLPPVVEPEGYVYHRIVLQEGIGGPLGTTLLMIFCTAVLGPACYAPAIFRDRFHAVIPRLPRWAWSLVGAGLAWPLAATGLSNDLALAFGLTGAAMAPVAGALAADYVRDRGREATPRRGVDAAALFAWAVGLAVGLIPYAGPVLGVAALGRVQPAAVLAFAAAFIIRILLGWFGVERPAEPPSLGGS